jgi:hypothetical protein
MTVFLSPSFRPSSSSSLAFRLPGLPQFGHQFVLRMHAQLPQDRLHVVPRGVETDAELLGDLTDATPGGEREEDFLLAT